MAIWRNNMALTKRIAAGLTAAAMLFTSFVVTACDNEVSGTFEGTETTPEVTMESSGGTSTGTTTDQGKNDNDSSVKVSRNKESLFNKYEALSREQLVMLDQLCEPQMGGNDLITWSNEKDFYDSLSPESKKLAGFKDVRFDETSGYIETGIDIIAVKDQELQKALAPYVKNGYNITSVVGENCITYNGERLVGNIFFNNGYHIASFSENLATTGFVVKVTDELFQAYMYALSRRAIIEVSKKYDYTVTKKDGIYQVNITGREMSDIEIEYDPSTGIMAYIIKIDPSDTVG